MRKQELVFRALAEGYIEGKRKFTQLALSSELAVSIGTVNTAVKNLEAINAVRIKRRSLEVSEVTRLMMYWATHRRLERDVIYRTHADMPVKEIESSMPPGVAFTAYTAYRRLFHDVPADYGEVYLYATDAALHEIKRRFPEKKGFPNLYVLAADEKLADYIMKGATHGSVRAPQVYVDLWNIDAWYAKDYADALAKRLGI